jgi:hypothetical protein
MTTYTKRTNAKRAAIKAGIPADEVEITVHKKDGEVRFGFKRKEVRAQAPAKAAGKAQHAPTAKLAVTPREQRNGVKRPAAGGLCAAVWQALDQMHAGGVTITAQAVRELATARNWNQSNASIEMYQWRKFMGLSKPRTVPKQKRAQAKEAAPAVVTEAAAS